jgi:hypothetical protein
MDSVTYISCDALIIMKANKNNKKESILLDKEKSEDDSLIKFLSKAPRRPIFKKYLDCRQI